MKKLVYLLPVILLPALALWAIRSSGAWYPMHDTTHIARLYLMEQAIRGGQFPPIWADTINNGYGYPLFHFYAPIFYYTALVIKLLVGSYLTALKLSLFLFIATGIAGVIRLASRWGRGASLLAAFAFGLSPYLAVDLYVRGAYAEIAGMMLFPWVLVAWEKLATKKRAVIAGVVTSLFLLSHNLVPVIAFPLLAIWILLNHYHRLARILLPALLTILVSSYFWLPLIFERSFVQADTIARVTDYSLHFVFPTQIWNSTWGFGGSGSGIEDGLSFKLGKLQLLLALLGVVALVRKNSRKALFFPLATIFALFMSTTPSRFIWDQLSFLAVIQFPWRFLTLAASLLAISASASILIFKNKLLKIIYVLCTITYLLFLNTKYFSPQWTFHDDESRYFSSQYLETISRIIPEFMPSWMSVTPEIPATGPERAYYPTWQVTVDGQEVPTSATADGLLSYPNPDSSAEIEISQSHTILENFSYFLTILGLGLSLYLWRRK